MRKQSEETVEQFSETVTIIVLYVNILCQSPPQSKNYGQFLELQWILLKQS
jgi:hypothetical protein